MLSHESYTSGDSCLGPCLCPRLPGLDYIPHNIQRSIIMYHGKSVTMVHHRRYSPSREPGPLR